jgi:hypothetical protein
MMIADTNYIHVATMMRMSQFVGMTAPYYEQRSAEKLQYRENKWIKS